MRADPTRDAPRKPFSAKSRIFRALTIRIGFIVNPIAGLGARVGLKGTDDVVEEALKRGAKPEAGARAERFLTKLPENAEIITIAGNMGESATELADRSAMIAHVPNAPSTGADTRESVRALATFDVHLIAFVGGDGTAADVYAGLQEAGHTAIPILGIPSGSKMYSSVFADTPEHAATVADSFDATRAGEILDIDEEAFRRGELRVTLNGVARVPHHAFVQAGKLAGADDDVEQESLAKAVTEILASEPGHHVLGAGTTMYEVKRALGVDGTLLGIDGIEILSGGEARLTLRDATETDLLGGPDPVSITVSPIGGQGFIFGRGNLPISSAVIVRATIPRVRVIATPSKLIDTPALHVDTGDPRIDAAFPKWVRVVTGYNMTKLVKVSP